MQFIYRTRDKVWDFYEVRILSGDFETVQGSKKVPSGHLGRVDFPNEQVTFHTHLLNKNGAVLLRFQKDLCPHLLFSYRFCLSALQCRSREKPHGNVCPPLWKLAVK